MNLSLSFSRSLSLAALDPVPDGNRPRIVTAAHGQVVSSVDRTLRRDGRVAYGAGLENR
jgi:hypothetical protein